MTMRVILGLVLLVGLMMFAGWLTVDSDGDSATATFNQQEAKKDTEEALQKGKELLEETEQAIERTAEQVDDTEIDVDIKQDPDMTNAAETDETATVPDTSSR